jgi:hypothetical protein
MLKCALATNTPLSTSEAAQIRNVLSQTVARLASIDEERQKILSLSLACQTVLSPLRTLPTEILREIFLLFALHELRASLLLSSICHRWREVASSIPQLWARIYFSPSDNSSEGCIELIKLCIDRSQSYPLSISLGNPHNVGNDILMAAMLRLAIPHIGRWKHFKWNARFSQDIPCSLPEFHAAPLLESLEVGTIDLPSSSRLFLWFQSVVRKAPRLHVLHIDGFQNYFKDVSWGQLTDIELKCRLSIVTCFLILSQAHRVERCVFNIHVASAMPSTSSLITLHHLKKCSIISSISLTELFDRISCPALQDLSLYQYDVAVWPKESFSSFMTRSSCSLLNFDTTLPEMTEEDAMQCLRDMPTTLISLELSTFNVTDQVLKLLTVGSLETNGSGCICPRLERITMRLAINTTDGVFADMVESRMHDSTELTNMQISRLSYVFVTFVDNKEDVERLLRWEKRRLEVVVDVMSGQE